jgi:hypothetical protein
MERRASMQCCRKRSSRSDRRGRERHPHRALGGNRKGLQHGDRGAAPLALTEGVVCPEGSIGGAPVGCSKRQRQRPIWRCCRCRATCQSGSRSAVRWEAVRFCGRRGGAILAVSSIQPLAAGAARSAAQQARRTALRVPDGVHHRAGPTAGSGRTRWLIRPAGASDVRSFGATSVANSSNEPSAFSTPYQGG